MPPQQRPSSKSAGRPDRRELEEVAGRLAVPVRYEKGEMRGGLCRLRDRWQIIINADLPDEEKADVLAESLSRLNLDAVFIPPRIRVLLEQAKKLSA